MTLIKTRIQELDKQLKTYTSDEAQLLNQLENIKTKKAAVLDQINESWSAILKLEIVLA